MTPPAPSHPVDRLRALGAEGYVDRCKRCRAATVHRLDAGLWRCECNAFRPTLTKHAAPWWRSPEVPA